MNLTDRGLKSRLWCLYCLAWWVLLNQSFGFQTFEAHLEESVDRTFQRTSFGLRPPQSRNPANQQTRNNSTVVMPGLYSLVYVTAPSMEVAKTLARTIISKELAACINLVPNIVSIYKWEGEITEDSETLMMIKTRTSRVDDLTNHVKSNHPYKVCEVISTKIENGNNLYLDWISQCVPEMSEKKDENNV